MTDTPFQPRYWNALGRWINPMGFGCWQLIGEYQKDNKPHGWPPIEEREAVYLIHHALERGVQFFDTASGYGDGRSEEILGRALASSSQTEDAVVCTKIVMNQDSIASGKINEAFTQTLERSLRLLNRSHIDVLLIHNPPDTLDFNQFDFSGLTRAVEKGKVLTIGVSSKSIVGAQRAVESGFGSVVEWVFNLLERRPITELFPLLSDRQYNFIARSPLSRGLFSPNRLTGIPRFEATDFRSSIDADWVRWVVESLQHAELGEEEKEGISKLALRYCLDFDAVSAVIPGINRMDYLSQLLSLSDIEAIYSVFRRKIETRTESFYPLWK